MKTPIKSPVSRKRVRIETTLNSPESYSYKKATLQPIFSDFAIESGIDHEYFMNLLYSTYVDKITQVSHLFKFISLVEQFQNSIFSHDGILHIIYSAEKCPPDFILLLLLLPIKKILSKDNPSDENRKEYLSIALSQLKKADPYIIFENNLAQPRKILRDIISILQGAEPKDISNLINHIKTQYILFAHRALDSKFSPRDVRLKFIQITNDHGESLEEIVQLFSSWEKIYGATNKVYRIMLKEPSFDIESLCSMLPISYATYLMYGIRVFMDEVGFSISICSNP